MLYDVMGISLETLPVKEKIKIIDLIKNDAANDYFVLDKYHPDKWMLDYLNEELQKEIKS